MSPYSAIKLVLIFALCGLSTHAWAGAAEKCTDIFGPVGAYRGPYPDSVIPVKDHFRRANAAELTTLGLTNTDQHIVVTNVVHNKKPHAVQVEWAALKDVYFQTMTMPHDGLPNHHVRLRILTSNPQGFALIPLDKTLPVSYTDSLIFGVGPKGRLDYVGDAFKTHTTDPWGPLQYTMMSKEQSGIKLKANADATVRQFTISHDNGDRLSQKEVQDIFRRALDDSEKISGKIQYEENKCNCSTQLVDVLVPEFGSASNPSDIQLGWTRKWAGQTHWYLQAKAGLTLNELPPLEQEMNFRPQRIFIQQGNVLKPQE
jgi:hypothetical protein